MSFVLSRSFPVALGVLLCAGACSPGQDATDGGDLDGSSSNDGPSTGKPDGGSITEAPPSQGLTIPTTAGPVTGRGEPNAIRGFLGVPYAAPPVGSLRWRPPQTPAPWTAPRDATQFGNRCMQANVVTGQPATRASEDCLFVNVWAPPPLPAGKRPVMVWIHGGAYFFGSGAGDDIVPGDYMYDGHALATKGVVVVSVNYRLGQFGFLAHDSLVAEDAHGSAGNYGILDQQAALKWVHDNAYAFGGDPENVTVFGESAGGSSVMAHYVSPLSAGLFQRATSESCAMMELTQPLHDDAQKGTKGALTAGATFATKLGCDTASDVAACMRGKPAAQVLATMPPTLNVDGDNVYWEPVIDGWVFPTAPWKAIKDGAFNHVPLLIGSNADESSLFLTTTVILSKDQYQSIVARYLPSHAAEIVDTLYPASLLVPYKDAFSQFATDFMFRCPHRAIARRVALVGGTVYSYFFSRRPTLTGAALGSHHAAEIAYVFGNLAMLSLPTAGDYALSTSMMDYWTRFASTANPNAAGAPLWPLVTSANDYLQFDVDLTQLTTQITAGTQLGGDRCATMEAWLDE